MRLSKDDASTSKELMNTLFRSRPEVVLDLIAAVKGLHELNSTQLTKLVKDSGSNIVRHIAEDGSFVQVDLEQFARYLPLQLISVVMGWERDQTMFKYLLCGVLLLHSMCELASKVPKIEQILLDDAKISEQLIDLVFYLIVVLGAYSQENHHNRNDIVLLHSALVACSLKLLTVIVSTNYQEIAQVLVAYYKADTFMDATFSAVCIDVKFLQTKLSVEQADSSSNTSPTAEETLTHLCQQCDSSLQILQSLCQQKLFRERIVKNKELCGNGGVLILVEAVLNLKMSPLYSAPSSYMDFVSRLKSKALSILLYLCEAESVSYLDEVANNSASQNLAKSIILQVLELLKKMFGMYPKGQLELNAMRLTDVFSDDSNFRSFIMTNFTEALAAIFLLPHGEFLSGWCSSDLPVCEVDQTLDVPLASYAHQRTSLLIKMMANLHCFVPDVCQDEKDLFLNKFVRFLQNEPQKPSDGFSSTFAAERTTTVSKNLSLLLSHAESLVPRFLNEDDVQLLRLFISQFESPVVPTASGDHPVQHCSPIQREVAGNHGNDTTNMEDGLQADGSFKEAGDVSRNGNNNSVNGEMKCGKMEHSKSGGSTINLRESERQTRIVETSGSDSSPTRRKNSIDRMDVDHIKDSGFGENLEDEKFDAIHSDEKQQRKRKRTVMNDKQVALIESAIVGEPDMHRNSTSLRLWADKLSLHGAEVTTSRLKNWLNNRKAKLARAAKDGRVPYEGENPERHVNSGQSDSPQSPIDEARLPSATRESIGSEAVDTAMTAIVDDELSTSLSTHRDVVRSNFYFEIGQSVVLVDDKAEEVGKGKVYQVQGNWCGTNLDQSGLVVVDIIELSVDRFSKLLHPMDISGHTFDQAEKRLGLMRVLWDFNKLLQFPIR